MSSHYDAVIIGAGVAGLIAAKELEAYHLKTLVLDAAPQAGGRLKTDRIEGFQLDHGFQVLLGAYPMVKKHLNLDALRTKAFASGAYCFDRKKGFEVIDVNRRPSAYLKMAFSPVGSLKDKLKMARLRRQVLAKSEEEIYNEADTSTLEFLQKFGFSNKIIEQFFKPFFGGIFLEHELATSSRQFQFIFKMFALGDALIPEGGIEAIAAQLKSQLQKTEFRFNTMVKSINPGKVHLEDGSEISTQQIIIAGDPSAIMPQYESDLSWNSTQQLYFSGPKGPLYKKLISLSFAKDGIISNIACLSAVQASYSKKGELYQVSLRENVALSETEIVEKIKRELQLIVGESLRDWKFLRAYKVQKSLPRVSSVAYERPFEESRLADGIYIAGDHLLNPSLNAAMLSGELAAKALILNHQNS